MEPTIRPPVFAERTGEPGRFFRILPKEWRNGIAPHWVQYQDTSRIFTLEIGHKVVGGGITFLKPAPDTLTYRHIAGQLFKNDRIYLGFLWIDPLYRGNDLGSYWIKNLRLKFPHKKFWLAIEDKGLLAFYQKNQFKIHIEIEVDGSKEWIMID